MNKLKELRKKYGYTVKEMAYLVGISQPYYTQIENKQRRFYYSLAVKIAKVFNLKPDDIFYDNL